MKERSFLQQCLSSSFSPFVVIAVALLPLFGSLVFFWTTNCKTKQLEEHFLAFQIKAKQKKASIEEENRILTQIKKSSPSFLEKNLRSLSFLESNRQQQQFHLLDADPDLNIRSLEVVKEEQNTLEFIEAQKRNTSFFAETELQQKKSLLVNANDIKTILLLLEQPKLQMPQIIIQSFSLEKVQKENYKDELYQLSLQLIQRETPSHD